MEEEQQAVKECRCVKGTCYIRYWSEGVFTGREPFDSRPVLNSHFEVSVGALPTVAPRWAGFFLCLNASFCLLYTHTHVDKYAGTCMWKRKGGTEDEGGGGNIKRIRFSHAEEAIQKTSLNTSFISDLSIAPQLSCLVDFTQAQGPDV